MAFDPSALAALLARAREAIAANESRGSGNYAALGPATHSGDRAYGRYQVMGNNIGPWTQAALGHAETPDQFLHDPAAQDAVFNNRFGSYLQKTGSPQDAASMWFTGRPLAQGGNAHDVLGTSGNQYVDKFMSNMPAQIAPQAQMAAIPPQQPQHAPGGIPPAVLAQASGSAPRAFNPFAALLSASQQQPTQFSPVHMAGPSQQQANGLSALVEALKQRLI